MDLIRLDEALKLLEEINKRRSLIVELKFFGGLTIDEIVLVLSAGEGKVSTTTVERDWRFARAWLHEELKTI